MARAISRPISCLKLKKTALRASFILILQQNKFSLTKTYGIYISDFDRRVISDHLQGKFKLTYLFLELKILQRIIILIFTKVLPEFGTRVNCANFEGILKLAYHFLEFKFKIDLRRSHQIDFYIYQHLVYHAS